MLSIADIALASALGLTELPVRRRIRVALFSTGDELVEPGKPLRGASLYDANRRLLTGLIESLGAVVTDLGILSDDRAQLAAALKAAAAGHDLVLTSGGVSTGEADHVRDAVETIGTLVFWRVAIKPGRPVAMGVIGEALRAFVGLPGNPVAAFVTFVRVVRPLILRLVGRERSAAGRAAGPCELFLRKKKGRREYVRVALKRAADGTVEAFKHPQDGAGVITSLTRNRRAGGIVGRHDQRRARRDRGLSALCGPDRLKIIRDLVRARPRSSGVLTLKKGSTGRSGHSAIAMPWRAVQISILCRSSSISA